MTTTMSHFARRCTWVFLMLGGLHVPVHGHGGAVSAEEAVRAAVVQRIASRDAEVSVSLTGLAGDAAVFREARLDPAARLGKPMRVTLVTVDGARLPATASIRVVAPRVVVRTTLARGVRIADGDIVTEVNEIVDAPLAPLLSAHEVVGARVARPLAAGDTILPGSVGIRRDVERGDEVLATAAGGAIEVTATLVAADGGRIGDRIRVRHPETKRYLRARIVSKGHVEVINAR